MKFLLACLSVVMTVQLVSPLAILAPETISLGGTVTSGCKTNDECTRGSCCVVSNPFIMSKRQLLISSLDLYSSGSCKPYLKEGEDCYSATFGSCGCEPGTTCIKVADLLVGTLELQPIQPLQPLQEKMLIYRPPGIYNCVRN